MSASGLSRRRVGGGGHGESSTYADDGENRPSVSRTGSSAGVHENFTSTAAGSAFERGNKVAYDPRDLEGANEDVVKQGGKMPKLTIMEEVLLLGIKDRQVFFIAFLLVIFSRLNGCLEGYLSFWNDNISYALRGCILIELALRKRIALVKDPSRRRLPLPDRLVTVIDDRQTGETILDEALKMMKGQEPVENISVNQWIDLLSGMCPSTAILNNAALPLICSLGETWNVLKIGFQLKQVRERLAKGLVDKGVLRTEKRNFLLFDMATHPVADIRIKESVVTRVVSLLTATTASVPPSALDKEGVQCRATRAMCLACAAYAASVLDNAFTRLTYEEREAAFQRCDDILMEFACWPWGSSSPSPNSRRRQPSNIGAGGEVSGRESVLGLMQEVRKESAGGDEDVGFELVAGVLEVLSKLDSLL
jgi:Golgi phosphoprotein 3